MTDPARLARAGRLGFAGLSLVAMVLALWTMGGPFAGRAEARDAARREDLRQLADFLDCVTNADDGRLPGTLSPDSRCLSAPSMVDPFTGAPYRYEVTSSRGYSLCAVFERADALGPDIFDPHRIFDPATGCLNVTMARP